MSLRVPFSRTLEQVETGGAWRNAKLLLTGYGSGYAAKEMPS